MPEPGPGAFRTARGDPVRGGRVDSTAPPLAGGTDLGARPRRLPRHPQRPCSRRPRQQASPKPWARQDAAGLADILILPLWSRSASASRSMPMPVSQGSPESRSPWKHLGWPFRSVMIHYCAYDD
ncbi:hypothetical protein NDU88_002182 [Pleurodeles waltl]|uniref:Uncharacterized protein n=1 Tax=Pleurodeles waltl TaxID=8319 RepID=A0AAV7MUX9_PLEWA|nr:hypothetical protein NDU88_002182 [Pleurodeles waltl]